MQVDTGPSLEGLREGESVTNLKGSRKPGFPLLAHPCPHTHPLHAVPEPPQRWVWALVHLRGLGQVPFPLQASVAFPGKWANDVLWR